MKKLNLISCVGIYLLISIFISCKNSSKEKDAKEVVAYQCPMDCEEGKTYAEAGLCPVCEMDLELIEN